MPDAKKFDPDINWRTTRALIDELENGDLPQTSILTRIDMVRFNLQLLARHIYKDRGAYPAAWRSIEE